MNILGVQSKVGHLVAHLHMTPRPAGDGVTIKHLNKKPADDSADNLAWATKGEARTGKPRIPVYALAAPGAVHFAREYASAPGAAAAVGMSASAIGWAMKEEKKTGGYFWTRNKPAGGAGALADCTFCRSVYSSERALCGAGKPRTD